jgi:hypothetical protein
VDGTVEGLADAGEAGGDAVAGGSGLGDARATGLGETSGVGSGGTGVVHAAPTRTRRSAAARQRTGETVNTFLTTYQRWRL